MNIALSGLYLARSLSAGDSLAALVLTRNHNHIPLIYGLYISYIHSHMLSLLKHSIWIQAITERANLSVYIMATNYIIANHLSFVSIFFLIKF